MKLLPSLASQLVIMMDLYCVPEKITLLASVLIASVVA